MVKPARPIKAMIRIWIMTVSTATQTDRAPSLKKPKPTVVAAMNGQNMNAPFAALDRKPRAQIEDEKIALLRARWLGLRCSLLVTKRVR